MERATHVYFPYGFAESVDVLCQQGAAALKQVDGEKIRPAGDTIATVIWHWRSLPESCIRRKALRFSALPRCSTSQFGTSGAVGGGAHPIALPRYDRFIVFKEALLATVIANA
jgi:hypothetical protein